jgi:hypothetical protein
MNIKWIPQRSNKKISYERKSANVLLVDGEEVSFADTSIVEYEIPEEISYAIQRAYRQDGELYLDLRRPYSEAEKFIWEQPHYYNEGGFRGSQYESYDQNGVLD